MTTSKTSVLIIGAGPTGLILALWLKKKGVDFRIIDKSSGPGETSRALAVQARTLEFYRQLGIVDALMAQGIVAKEIILRRVGRVVAKARLGAAGEGLSPFPNFLFCSQDVHEGILCEELVRHGVEVERKTELLEFSQDNNGVKAKIRTSRGEEIVLADYMAGCDGARSLVRHGLNIDFPGGTYSQVFYVADVAATGEMTGGGVQISLSKKDFCIVMPIQKKNSIRLTGIVPPEQETKEKIEFSDVQEAVEKNTQLKISKVNWFSTYHVHHRVVNQFRKGRVFLVGDAAHIHSPAGGQGMNTGIGDAINLAWKLAEVVQGRAKEKLLFSYEEERKPFAYRLVATTDTAFHIIASRSFFGSIFRAFIMPTLFSFLVRLPQFLRFAFLTVSQTRITYRKSSLNRGVAGKLEAGDRLPWISFSGGDNYLPLQSLAWQIHIYGKAHAKIHAAAKDLDLAVHEFTWTKNMEKVGLQEDALYLIRPDGHVGLVANQNAEELRSYMQGL